MSTIQRIINDILRDIPEELFHLIEKDTKSIIPRSPETVLLDILRKDILPDLDVMFGKTVKCYLTDIENVEEDINGVVYRVPETILQGRDIVDAITILTNVQPQEIVPPAGETTPMGGVKLTLINRNTIFATYPQLYSGMISGTLHIMVGYDSKLNDIPNTAYPLLADFCRLGVERILHTRLSIALGDSAIYHGHASPVIAGLLRDWKESGREYKKMRRGNVAGMLWSVDEEAQNLLVGLQF